MKNLTAEQISYLLDILESSRIQKDDAMCQIDDAHPQNDVGKHRIDNWLLGLQIKAVREAIIARELDI